MIRSQTDRHFPPPRLPKMNRPRLRDHPVWAWRDSAFLKNSVGALLCAAISQIGKYLPL